MLGSRIRSQASYRTSFGLDLGSSLLVEAQDGGLLFLARDGALWIVQPEELQQRKPLPQEVKPLSQADQKRMLNL